MAAPDENDRNLPDVGFVEVATSPGDLFKQSIARLVWLDSLEARERARDRALDAAIDACAEGISSAAGAEMATLAAALESLLEERERRSETRDLEIAFRADERDRALARLAEAHRSLRVTPPAAPLLSRAAP